MDAGAHRRTNTHHTLRPPTTRRLSDHRSPCACCAAAGAKLRAERSMIYSYSAEPSLKRGCTAAAPSWRSLRTQLQTAASPRLNMPRLQDARQYSDMRACASVAAFARVGLRRAHRGQTRVGPNSKCPHRIVPSVWHRLIPHWGSLVSKGDKKCMVRTCPFASTFSERVKTRAGGIRSQGGG